MSAEAKAAIDPGRSEVKELPIPDFPKTAFAKIMEHLERPNASDEADLALIEGLELEVLLQLVGVAYRLGAISLLNLGASKVAAQISEASSTTGERAGVPMDVYLCRDPEDALSDDEALASLDEFIFTLPDNRDAPLPTPPRPASPPPPPKPANLGSYQVKYNGGVPASDHVLQYNAHMVPSKPKVLPTPATRAAEASAGHESDRAAAAARNYGTGAAGTGGVGTEHLVGLAKGCDRLVQLLGGEAPLLACLQRCNLKTLRSLKPRGRRWRYRIRTALCSGAWAEAARAMRTLDLGRTRHWERTQRVAAAKFLANGQCNRLEELKADGYEAALQPLLGLESFSVVNLLGAITTNPFKNGEGDGIGGSHGCSGSIAYTSLDSDGLCAQSEFCSLLALWLISSSPKLREADCRSLTYSGLLPFVDALGPAVELGSRRSLERIFLSTNALPIRHLVGLPPPPPPVSAPVGSLAAADRLPSDTVDLKWKGLGALEASLIATLLRANRTITRLDLSWNSGLKDCGSRGAEDLANAIASSRSLIEVDLSESGLGEGCSRALVRAVRECPALTKLNVRSCGLGVDARTALTEAVALRSRSSSSTSQELQLIV